jgi:hypothetical protein
MEMSVQLTLTPLYPWAPKLWYPLRAGWAPQPCRCEEPKNLSGSRTQFPQLSSPQPTHATDWKCLFHVGTGCFLVLSATAELLIYFDTIKDTDTALSMPRAINCWQSYLGVQI